ncbi:hypothetical protein METBIDRAFT_30452 [Metschnikowia bicuspidata var. bicuspidata NRRL YB-4993]|uniref:Eukaryotic translation initiation factor 3 subunit C n=1 Tax=Metschnikowia bicuspidata var. bicuspidata NRRL YB-4993 TaxID=869754 RepID=A0A1A0HJW9_9ASCO|nr:hypothetical protein METBIDRAFT_30452 [Metschnikowia bicuspidata var. bicuspidata NRRL YB-4993]OBA24108.1 hypothetical protein METBIDRAFT_30452 [Metschnikowia bicuspidata var. bicuspidata NRRL YB-4993]
MSRFFASGYTADSSLSEEDLLTSSDEEMATSEDFSTDSEFAADEPSSDDDDSDYVGKGPAYFLKKDFLKGSGANLDLDLDDEGPRVVKSAKEKLAADVTEAVDAIYNAQNLQNWAHALTEFERVGKLAVRVRQQQMAVPNCFYKMLAQLDGSIADAAADKERKRMPADQSRAFNNLRQRVRKQAKESAAHMALFREQPALFDADEPVEVAAAEPAAAGPVVGTVSGTARDVSPVFVALKQVADARGRKNADRLALVASVERLLADASAAGSVFETIAVFQMLLAVRFDAGAHQSHMPVDLWKHNERDADAFLALLEQHLARYQVSELGAVTDDLDIEPAPNAAGVRVVLGSIAALVERLDDEFAKCLQFTDPHSSEYMARLRDEALLYTLIVRAQVYVQATAGPSEHLARLVLRRLDHIYYKPDLLIAVNEAAAWGSSWAAPALAGSPLLTKGNAPEDTVRALADFLALQQGAVYRRSALLASTYYLAVNGRYAEARLKFLDSQIYNHIYQAEAPVQVLYNRAIVQMGLSAFKNGRVEESHQILNEIINSQRLKELLGQGFNSKYPSQATVAEKQKLLPFHMHINLELVECVFMTSSMLIEIPALAAATTAVKDSKRKTTIKSFKSKLEFHDRQFFTGPPESIKDHLIYASKLLQKGNWAKAYELLASIKIWKLLTDTDLLLSMLKRQLQIEGLRTYIFTYKAIFAKLSIEKLATTFQLDKDTVTEIVEKMLAKGEVKGSLENAFINFATDEPQRSKLQELAIIMNEKVGLLNEKNEMTASNGYGKKQAIQQHQQQQKEQKEQKESLQEENSRFRYANVSTHNDEFQV